MKVREALSMLAYGEAFYLKGAYSGKVYHKSYVNKRENLEKYLIDADALMKHKGDCYDAGGHLLYAVGTGNILRAPTIIPAEEDE